MSQQEIEVILARQLAGYLAIPIFIVDPEGNLVYYNEPAEAILGHRFDETGQMPLAEWSTIYAPTDAEGRPLGPDALPLHVALKQRRPSQRAIRIRGLDNVVRHIEVLAFPLVGQPGRELGAVAMFWEGEP